jgi:hypothetical protein
MIYRYAGPISADASPHHLPDETGYNMVTRPNQGERLSQRWHNTFYTMVLTKIYMQQSI